VAARDLWPSALALLCGLGAGELILGRVQWDDAHEGPEHPATRPDARLGWALEPARATGVYRVNHHGERAARVDDDGDPATPALVVAGESIAFGWGLPWDDTFAARAGRDLGLAVVNAAAPALGVDQAYLRLLDALARLERPAVVAFLFVPRQLGRTLAPTRPHLELEDGRLVPVPAASGLAALHLARLFHDEPYHGEARFATMRAILLAVAAAARAHGARPLFVVTNYGPACPPGGDDVVRALFDGLPAVRVDLAPEERLGPSDPHPDARGAAKLAAAIVAAVR
jgi:hypothetical protein